MLFAIRDDDTCYYSSPQTLKSTYRNIWDRVPITLACVPRVAPRADVLPEIPSTATEHRFLGENNDLIDFLWRQDSKNRIAIVQHGYDHGVYRGKPEFVAGPSLTNRLERGKRHLEEVFETDIDIFVPPHAQLSSRGVQAVSNTDMNIVREYGPKPREVQLTQKWFWTYSRMVLFYLYYRHEYRYPIPLDYGTHREIYCHRLGDETSFSWLQQAFDYIKNYEGVFCISTHAPELSDTGIRTLERIVNYADGQAEFVTCGEILDRY